MKGLEASLSLSLSLVRTNLTQRTTYVVPGKKLDILPFRRTQYLLSKLAKEKVHLLKSGHTIQQFSIFKESNGGGELFLFSYSLTCAASISVVEKRMCMRYTLHKNNNTV